MEHDAYSDGYILGILERTRTIALVGASATETRPSYVVMKFLLGKGYGVVPVNPGKAGTEILGQKVYASLAEIPAPFEMVDVFRASEAAGSVTDEAIALARERGVRTVWMQLGVRDDRAAARAEAAGLEVVMDRCPKIELEKGLIPS